MFEKQVQLYGQTSDDQASQVTQWLKNPSANARTTRDMGSIPGLGRTPGEGKGYLLQYSGLENSIGQNFIVYGVAKSQT